MGCIWELERPEEFKARALSSETPVCELHFSVVSHIESCGLELNGTLIFSFNAVVLKPNQLHI